MAGEELICGHCGRTGGPGEVALGWVVSRPPRPVGQTGPRYPDQDRTTALCPDCARRHVRDLEARLDV